MGGVVPIHLRRSKFGHANVIYVMGADQDGPVKIGMSSDMAKRVLTLQTGNPLPLMIHGFRLVMPKNLPPGRQADTVRHLVECASRVEKHVHYELQKMELRLMGEWFDLTADEALAVLDKAAPTVQCRAFSLEELSGERARLDPEYGWMNDDLLAKAMQVKAQACASNDAMLTIMRKGGILA